MNVDVYNGRTKGRFLCCRTLTLQPNLIFFCFRENVCGKPKFTYMNCRQKDKFNFDHFSFNIAESCKALAINSTANNQRFGNKLKTIVFDADAVPTYFCFPQSPWYLYSLILFPSLPSTCYLPSSPIVWRRVTTWNYLDLFPSTHAVWPAEFLHHFLFCSRFFFFALNWAEVDILMTLENGLSNGFC